LIVTDSSVLIPWAEGIVTAKTDLLDHHIEQETLRVAPVVITELLSTRDLRPEIRLVAETLDILEMRDGYWERAGLLRGKCLAAGRRARLADTLIAQACLDADLPLLTSDADFEVFRLIGGLRLVETSDQPSP
jgi:predicted nucleic acid-binding protein